MTVWCIKGLSRAHNKIIVAHVMLLSGLSYFDEVETVSADQTIRGRNATSSESDLSDLLCRLQKLVALWFEFGVILFWNVIRRRLSGENGIRTERIELFRNNTRRVPANSNSRLVFYYKICTLRHLIIEEENSGFWNNCTPISINYCRFI